MMYLRRVEGVLRTNRIGSDDIKTLRQEVVLETVLRKKEDWQRKVEEVPDERD